MPPAKSSPPQAKSPVPPQSPKPPSPDLRRDGIPKKTPGRKPLPRLTKDEDTAIRQIEVMKDRRVGRQATIEGIALELYWARGRTVQAIMGLWRHGCLQGPPQPLQRVRISELGSQMAARKQHSQVSLDKLQVQAGDRIDADEGK